MSLTVLDQLKTDMTIAHRTVASFVFRATTGDVFRVEVAAALRKDTGPAYCANVMRIGPGIGANLGICEAGTIDDAFVAAQQMIAQAVGKRSTTSAVPRPHIEGIAS